MAKIKLTKGELKKQRDSLKQFQRYLPTLQLKKQQLQMEVLRWSAALDEKLRLANTKKIAAQAWAGLLIEGQATIKQCIVPSQVVLGSKNIAGVDLAVFEQARFPPAEYDLFAVPAWVDVAIDFLRELVSLQEEIKVMRAGIESLRRELRITAQRVNLFEKVKIPEALEAIRLIKIYIGDQMANAVGRCKTAKRKIEELEAIEAAA
ncbi:MAG: V-type ATP synthase subunit D [Candidatus Omnitrophica bacterium]|jgi:V/A-type H+-transporting ATPase subunit D|nr:V-type ATP synthase subunit D [Candidatus Omnitrophota bacterium]